MANGDRRAGRRRTRGFTYLAILIAVVILGVGLALAGEVWHTTATREKEAELLFVGNQYRRAIERYFLAGTATYPRALSDLLRDPRKPVAERYLRRLYPDPVTGRDEWGIVRSPDGGVMGVYSLSEAAPLKSANFRARDREFETAAKYSDWKFVYMLPATAATGPVTAPGIQRALGGATPAAPPAPAVPPGLMQAPGPAMQ